MSQSLEQKTANATSTLFDLLDRQKTVSLATTNEEGVPQVSYAPVAVDAERNAYIFVSELSEHTANLKERGLVSVMWIQDEATTNQLFARNRLTVEGHAQFIERDSEKWEHAAATYRARFGKFFEQLTQLRDFHMFCVTPQKARIVVGFGAAFEIALPDWQNLTLMTGR